MSLRRALFSTLRSRAPFSARAFSVFASLKSATPAQGHSKEPVIPGFREEGQIAGNFELATGVERYEYLKKLKGEDPWEDFHPVILSKPATVADPVIITGSDAERYIGCTGFPVDTHETVWLTIRDHGPGKVDRCPHCGSAFKYNQHHHH
ncbi:Cytochrome c oxidase subunit 5B [Nowakowskiella sp. JEL0407]|nr:Cytochrome c oxidase subunit 5B [Nowakowskiella sp. JEL0407]